MAPKVSVIVPIYNGEDYIHSFMANIENQHYENFEVIFVDDGSTDNTLSVCEKLEQKNEKIKVIHKNNGGPSSARNVGIDSSTGDYIVFFDIDDEFSDSILSDNVKIAIENDAEVVMWNFRLICLRDGKDSITKIGKNFNGNSIDFFHNYLISVLDNEMFNPPWNKLIKRSVIIDNDIRFDERFSIYEDILFSYQLQNNIERISVNDDIYYDYIIKEKGSLLTKFHEECFEVILEIFKEALRYGARFQDNSEQIKRFKEQMLHLTKGFIKQICITEDCSYNDKKKLLSEISNNPIYMMVSSECDNKMKAFPAKIMMRFKLYCMLIMYYKVLDFFR